MKDKKIEPKTECEFYRNNRLDRGCKILTELVCKNCDRCSFYKPKEK